MVLTHLYYVRSCTVLEADEHQSSKVEIVVERERAFIKYATSGVCVCLCVLCILLLSVFEDIFH
jgi:hypothetical protein